MTLFAEIPELLLDLSRPIALLADLHGNWEATRTVCEWLDTHGLEQALLLGDVIGYGASPRDVLEEVRERAWPVLRGNHEEMLANGTDQGFIKERARLAIEWTREALDSKTQRWLTTLPLCGRLGATALAVHGSLAPGRHAWAYIYDLSMEINLRALAAMEPPQGTVVFFGHTHHPCHYQCRGEEWEESEIDFEVESMLSRSHHHFVNPGSVGYPRDGDPRASFAIWRHDQGSVRWIRLGYDVQTEAQKLIELHGAEEMAQRLLAAR